MVKRQVRECLGDGRIGVREVLARGAEVKRWQLAAGGKNLEGSKIGRARR